MARLFNFEDIVNGKVPKPDDFLRAKRALLDNLNLLYEAGLIHGARIFGSTASNRSDIRSDIDIIVVLDADLADPETFSLQRKLLQDLLHRIYQEYNISTEASFLYKQYAEDGIHLEDPIFIRYLQSTPEGNVVGNDPIRHISISRLQTTHASVLIGYFNAKLHKFSRSMLANPEERLKLLQRALELPSNAGRMLLRAFHDIAYEEGTSIYDTKDSDADSKEYAIRGYRRFYQTFHNPQTEEHMLQDFEFLVNANLAYSEVLNTIVIAVERARQELNDMIIQAYEEKERERVWNEYMDFCNRLQSEYDPFIERLERECIPRAYRWIGETEILCREYIKDGYAFNNEVNTEVEKNN